ncbi:MAG: hypothetical protein ACRD21_22575, partial [Vicinamibacteria bacterium]
PDLVRASVDDLRYRVFLGDVLFHANHHDLSARWGWVPLLDFALGLRKILRNLKEGEFGIFDFTDSDATIRFQRNEEMVEVTASYAPGSASVLYKSFLEEVDRFAGSVSSRLVNQYPELIENRNFHKLKDETP